MLDSNVRTAQIIYISYRVIENLHNLTANLLCPQTASDWSLQSKSISDIDHTIAAVADIVNRNNKGNWSRQNTCFSLINNIGHYFFSFSSLEADSRWIDWYWIFSNEASEDYVKARVKAKRWSECFRLTICKMHRLRRQSQYFPTDLGHLCRMRFMPLWNWQSCTSWFWIMEATAVKFSEYEQNHRQDTWYSIQPTSSPTVRRASAQHYPREDGPCQLN